MDQPIRYPLGQYRKANPLTPLNASGKSLRLHQPSYQGRTQPSVRPFAFFERCAISKRTNENNATRKDNGVLRCLLRSAIVLCLFSCSPALPVLAQSNTKAVIEIHRAIYGSLEDASQRRSFCDASAHVQRICQGVRRCRLKVDDKMCGDPAPSQNKYLDVEYSCGAGHRILRVNKGGVLILECP
ncbi:MAG: hypothetical protein PWQ57_1845 [Desulfovibrionales bacterium]|nr:hypothetical protein [Desulfovibrionales bacterium]